MDLEHYRKREAQARSAAAGTLDPNARAAHIDLADRYLAVISAYEQVDRDAARRTDI